MHVGTFGAPLGLKGEIRINCLTKTIQVFKSLNEYFNFDQSVKCQFSKMLTRNNKLLVQPNGYSNRNEVELLRSKKTNISGAISILKTPKYSKPRTMPNPPIIAMAGAKDSI